MSVTEKIQIEANYKYLIRKFLLNKNAACFVFDFNKPSLGTATKAIRRNKIINDYKS